MVELQTMAFWKDVMKMEVTSSIEAGARVLVTFTFPADYVGIRFEYERTAWTGREDLEERRIATRPRGEVALVVYVDAVDDFAARAREQRFTVFVEPAQSPGGVRAAVLLDPSGLRIRIYEGERFGVSLQRSHGRMGYVVVPSKEYSQLEDSAKFYAVAFYQPMVSSGTAGSRSGSAGEGNGRAVAKDGAAGSSSGVGLGVGELATAVRKTNVAYRLIDVEKFSEELVTSVWFGNGPRSTSATVCYRHTLRRRSVYEHSRGARHGHGAGESASSKTHVAGTNDRPAAGSSRANGTQHLSRAQQAADALAVNAATTKCLFVGVSFHVRDLERAIIVLQQSSPAVRVHRHAIPGLPRCARFFDPASVLIEMTDGEISPRDEPLSI